MNRDEAFELQLARWLEEGPFVAPTEPVTAALDHARTHPRRQPVEASWWRRAMSGMTLTHVPSRQSRGWLAAAAAVILVIVGIGGYGLFNANNQGGGAGGATPTPAITPQPTPTAGPSATPRVTPTPAPTLGPGMSTARETCVTADPGETTTVAGVVQTRNEVLHCTDTATDPRLDGDSTITLNSDEHPNGDWFGWGTVELTNAGGSWNGYYVISTPDASATMEFNGIWFGSGGYEGLEAVHRIVSDGGASTLTSRVFEAGTVITGTERCVTTSGGTEVGAGDVTASRGVELRCTDTMSDARVSGQDLISVAIDTRADQSAELWGSSRLSNAEGGWDGRFFGTVDAGYTVHHLRGLMRGTGAYEGLLFRLEVAGTGDPEYQLSGEIIPGF